MILAENRIHFSGSCTYLDMILSGAGAGHAGGVTGPAIHAKALTPNIGLARRFISALSFLAPANAPRLP
jgi:hypothetical protein